MSPNLIVGNDGRNTLQGTAGADLIYGFDPSGPQAVVTSIAATRVASGLQAPLFATAPPGDTGRLFIVEQTGAIKILDLNTGQVLATPFLNVTVDSTGERGLLGLAFDPNYATNGFFYIYRTVPGSPAHNEVDRYHVSANPNVADVASATPVISLDNLSAAINHNAGWIGFGPDGDLYIAAGENANAPNSQSLTNLLGKILRIDVHGDAFPADPAANYAIPADNPFVGTPGARGEIFALGLRNPFRDSFDRDTGDFFIGDVGQSAVEEINAGIKGANYGWPLAEGPSNNPAFTNPLFSYNHTVGQAIIGGYVYRGSSEGLQGQYFFADEVAGKVFTMRFDGNAWISTDRTSQIMPSAGAINNPTSFGEDGRGNLYLTDFDGDVFRLTPLVASADQADRLNGNGGDDILFAGTGNDLLSGGPGNDYLVGGTGNDIFHYAPGDGADVVADFAAGPGMADRINLAGFTGIHNLGDVLALASQAGTNTVLDFGAGNSLTLQGVAKANLNADDFVFGPTTRGDFDGNGQSDILWYEDNLAVAIWDNGQLGGAYLTANPGAVPAGWHIAGKGDFDGNGIEDILWNNDNGAAVIWDGGQISAARLTAGPGMVPNGWHIAGTGDFDGNGHDDVLWQNDNGAVAVWDNGQINAAHTAANAGVIPNSWHIAGTGDFDGNGHDDILWKNDDGSVAIWDNGQLSAAHLTGAVPNSWHIAGTGDFDGNGRDDILWRNDNGAVAIWDNGQITAAHAAGVVPNSWHIAGTGDFDGNGRDDILWRNDNGAVAIWDNGQITAAHAAADAGIVPPDWHIV
jgi:glucose/arabinose dehydrogenase